MMQADLVHFARVPPRPPRRFAFVSTIALSAARLRATACTAVAAASREEDFSGDMGRGI